MVLTVGLSSRVHIAGVPGTNAQTGVPKRVADSLCDTPCPGNNKEICGDENQTVASAYSFTCTASPAALHQPICNLNFSQWWNGSDWQQIWNNVCGRDGTGRAERDGTTPE